MKQKIAQSRAKFEGKAYEIILSGAELFQDQSHKVDFLSALDEQHTIHGFEAFIANCLPVLVNALQKRKPKCRQRSTTSHTQKKSVSQNVSNHLQSRFEELVHGGARA